MFCVAIILLITVFQAQAEETIEKDDGFIGSCPLSFWDLTFSSSSTDYIRIMLVAGYGETNFHTYNISKASSVMKDSGFRKDYRTVLFVHGYNDKPGALASPSVIDAYQSRGRHNILLSDCSSLTTLDYLRSARATRYAGIRLGKLITQLYRQGLNLDTFEVVGFSLGAHISGHIGKTFYKSTGKKLPRITGLDPAGPCFRDVEAKDRLDKSDADFVQVIHTNGGQLGLMSPVGHVDFYLNGGRRQPSVIGFMCFLTCSHLRIIEIWKFAVIYPNKFIGIKCNSVAEMDDGKCAQKGRKTTEMGPAANPKNKGIYYVKTTGIEPYYPEASEAYYDDC